MAQKTLGEVNKRIAAVTAEIAKLELEYKKLQAQGKNSVEIQKELSKQFDSLTKKLTTLTNVTKQYNNQSKTTAANASKANANLAAATKRYGTLSSTINKANIAQANSTKQTRTFGQAFAMAFSPRAWGSAIGNVVKFLGVYQLLFAAFNAVKSVTLGSIQAFIAFEDSIGKLRSIVGSNAEQTKVLSESIRQAAVQTRFTATEVSGLATSLAKLGATADEIPSLLLPISLAAQALGTDLAKVGETVFKVSNQFGLSASESATTAQTLVAAINSSALSLETFNTAIQYIGPIASQVGLTFAETSGYLQTLADNGFSASRIGTGLRGIFIDLKESGVPLIDTLQKLADENISVARATDLVGKRAAAQLISILDNLDAVRESADENNQFAESLRASAAQINTAAGQLDILKSAYEDLRISIGDTITSTELYLDLLGLLNEDSEQLARGYKLLDNIFSQSGGFEIVSKQIEVLSAGTVDASTAITTALATVGQAKEAQDLIKVFEDIAKAEVELNGATLSTNQIFDILQKKTEENGATFQTYLREIGLTGQEVFKLNTALNNSGVSLENLENQIIGVQGIAGIFEKQASAVQASNQVSEERNRIEADYADEIQKIKDLTIGSNASKEESRRVQKELNDEIKKTEEELEKERAKGVLANKVYINQLEGRISGYRNVRKEIADLNDETEDDIKAAEAARKAQLKSDKDGIERRRAEIKEEIRQIKKIRDERIKAIEEQKARDLERASTAAEAADIEIKAAQDIAEANGEVEDSLVQVSNKTQKLTEDTIDLQTKYKKDFPEAFDDFALSFEKILFDIQSAITDVQFTPEELADQLVGQASSVFKEFEQNLASLKDYYGDTIQGQRDFAIASQEQFQRLKENVDKITEQYNQTKAALTLLLGEDAANEILAPVAGSIDIISNKLNELGFDIEKSSKEIAERTKQEINSILVDGLGDALAAAIEALDKFNETAFNNTKDRLDREKDQIEARYEIEEDILKSQLQNQLITEEEFRTRQTKLRQKQIGEENAIEKALFDAQQKRDRQSATTDYLQALASIVPNLIITDKEADPVTIAIKSAITAGIATVSYGAELGAISQRKFIPKKFAEGGVVEGPSHAQGGVPFTVQGKGGYEMEGGEFIVNKRAAQLHRTVLERINNSTKVTPMAGKYTYSNDSALRKFAEGGIVGVSQSVQQASSEQLEYLKAIAQATTSTAVGVSKPVRAFVSSSDLNTNEAERKIKERNTRI